MSLLEAGNIAATLGGTRIPAGIDFRVGGGEVVGLIGPNGAGKTTLLRILAGLLRPVAGSVRLDGRPTTDIDRRAHARMVGYLPQGGEAHWAVTVETLVTLGRSPHIGLWRAPSEMDRVAVARAMDICDVGRFADRPMPSLSGGERARAFLARVLAGEPKIILADEPVAGLDPAHQLDVMETLRDRARAGTAVAVVMHDLSLAARFCNRLVMISNGLVAADGPPATVLSTENLARYYGISAHQGLIDGLPYVLPIDRVRSRPTDIAGGGQKTSGEMRRFPVAGRRRR